MELVGELVASEGISALVATHDTLLPDVADVVVELRDGQLVDGRRG
jgi:putative ABC transport system ATP-binding protein